MQNAVYDNASDAIRGGLDTNSNTNTTTYVSKIDTSNNFVPAILASGLFLGVMSLILFFVVLIKFWNMMCDVKDIKDQLQEILDREDCNVQLSTPINQIQEDNDSDNS